MNASEIVGLLRFGIGVRRFVRTPISAAAAKSIVLKNMQRRPQSLLKKIESAIFGYRNSPYLALLRHAGCELGDIRLMLDQDGVEGTLERLRDAGVYVTYEEYKGLASAVRGNARFDFRAKDFDNPILTRAFRGSTGGSSGRLTHVWFDLDAIAQTAPHWGLWIDAHGWSAGDHPLVLWWPGHPGAANGILRTLKVGKPYKKWFVQVRPAVLRDRIAAAIIHALVRQAGGLTKPVFAPSTAVEEVGTYICGLLDEDLRPCIRTTPSQAIRLSQEVAGRGRRLDGVAFWLGGEPITPGRRHTIEEHGAKAVPLYGFSEGGNVGYQCPNGRDDDVHIMLDAYAVIQRRRKVHEQEDVDALLITSFVPAGSKVLFNMEIGDYGTLETRSCGCAFDALGYTRHVHTIRSFDKLTGEGVTFVGADLFELLERTLPKRFGGVSGDYQIVEELSSEGIIRYVLRVDPAVGPVDETAICHAFLDGIAAQSGPYRVMASVWRENKALRVERQAPIVTVRGKVFPFRTMGQQQTELKPRNP